MSSTTPLSTINPAAAPVARVPSAGSLPSDRHHPSVKQLTESLFAGVAKIRLEIDPEFATPYFVVEATAEGSEDQVFELDKRWHRSLPEAAGEDAPHYCLALRIRS